MKTRILQSIDFERVNTLLEGFNQSTGFVTAILDLDGNILSKSGWRTICTEFHRINPETAGRCTISDTVLAGEMKKGEKFHCYKCLNGLVDVAVPIIIKGEHIANLFSGQFFFEKPDRSFFIEQAGKYGFSESGYLAALEAVPVIAEEKVKAIMEFLLNMTQLISDITYQSLDLSKLNKTLHNSYDLLKNLSEQVPGVIYQYRLYPDGRSAFPYSSPGMFQIYEVTSDEVREDASPVFTRIHPDDYDYIVETITESAKNQTEYHSEFRVILPSQGERWRLCNAKPELLEDGSTLWHGIIMDITDRIQQQQDLISAKEKIEKNEEKFRKAFNTNPEAITITSVATGTYVSVNNGFVKMFEYAEAEALGHSSKALNIWNDYADRDYFIDTLKKSGIIENYETKFRTKSGKIVDGILSSAVIELENAPHILSITRDISYRKRVENELRESKEQLHFAFEGSNDGLWDVNMKTGSVYLSSRGCEILGYRPDEMEEVARVWSDLVHPADMPLTNMHLQAHLDGKNPVFEVEQRLRTKSGGWKWILSRGKVVSRDPDGVPLRMTGTHTDISERVAIQEALISKNRELEASEEQLRVSNEELTTTYDAIKVSSLELEKAKEKAEENNRLKTAFLQNMSHEIRTPMNAIMGFSELLAENFDNKPILEKYSDIICRRCNDLLVIIDDILDIAKIESGQASLKIESCHVDALFTDLKNLFTAHQARLNKQHIQLVLQPRTEPGMVFYTDAVKLKQILINLIGNAFKYTSDGLIEAGYHVEKGHLIFFVSDTGIGIPAEKQQLIFERFIQIEPAANRLYGGNGLGLSIVKGLVELLGGKIWLKSEVNKGSVFYVSLPILAAEPHPTSPGNN